MEGRVRRPRSTASTQRRPQQRRRLSRLGKDILEKAENALTMKAVEMAMRGDKEMLRLCFNRLDRLRDRETKHLGVNLPEIKSIADIPTAIRIILDETAKGIIEPNRGSEIIGIIASLMNSMNNSDLVERLEKLYDSAKN